VCVCDVCVCVMCVCGCVCVCVMCDCVTVFLLLLTCLHQMQVWNQLSAAKQWLPILAPARPQSRPSRGQREREREGEGEREIERQTHDGRTDRQNRDRQTDRTETFCWLFALTQSVVEQPCKFGMRCTNPNCAFGHPPGFTPAAAVGATHIR
jgi:hypothetical protein